MARIALDLARTAVFLDFDGTISTADVGMHLLEAAAPHDEWWALHEQYERGEIESRECLVDQWALVTGTEADLRAAAGEVEIDPGFQPLVASLRAAGADVTVVSDGFGFYVHDVCAPLGLRVLTNAVDFHTGELRFPHEDRCCPCSSCGVCKQAPIKDARYEGKTTMLVGDGASDRKAALLADVVFAKGPLAAWCRASGVACVPFDTLTDVHDALFG
ncbi:MAG TPA: MtnX-like HAD-IB family phosphatase [Acidimicrobiia bacterium]|nr:MtnX-like HAD-IB family phosphatase [Acidimicrobiia bacterium]